MSPNSSNLLGSVIDTHIASSTDRSPAKGATVFLISPVRPQLLPKTIFFAFLIPEGFVPLHSPCSPSPLPWSPAFFNPTHFRSLPKTIYTPISSLKILLSSTLLVPHLRFYLRNSFREHQTRLADDFSNLFTHLPSRGQSFRIVSSSSRSVALQQTRSARRPLPCHHTHINNPGQ